MISNKLSTLGLGSEYSDITKLSETIGNLATQMQNENETSENNAMTITVYENKGRTRIISGSSKGVTSDSF